MNCNFYKEKSKISNEVGGLGVYRLVLNNYDKLIKLAKISTLLNKFSNK